jgi:hypothetical protein
MTRGTREKEIALPGRVARASFPCFFLLSDECRWEDTTSRIHRGVIRRGCPILAVFARAGPLVPLAMPKGLKRYYGQKHLYFVTCSCYRRFLLLGSVTLSFSVLMVTLSAP